MQNSETTCRDRGKAVLDLLSKLYPGDDRADNGSDEGFYQRIASYSLNEQRSLWYLLAEEDDAEATITWKRRIDALIHCVSNLNSSQTRDDVIPFEIEAAGIAIGLEISIVSELWLTLLPLVLWIRARSSKVNDNQPNDNKRHFIVGLSGPPGAGKTVMSKLLKQIMDCTFPNESHSVLSMDAYHHYNEYLEARDMKRLKGAPETFDVAKFSNDLRNIKAQKKGDDPILLPEYDRNVHNPVEGRVSLPAPGDGESVILVEGLFLLYHSTDEKDRGWDEISNLIDLHLLFDVEKEECKRRVVDRKVIGGRSRRDSEEHFDRVDSVNYDRILSPQAKAKAHLLLKLKPDSFSLFE